jgi:predicted small secreted protein
MKALTILIPLFLAGALLMSGCASTRGHGEATQAVSEMDLDNPDVAVRTADNGDVIQEFRVAGALRMVKITPTRGPAYYLYDDNGDGKVDRSNAPNQGDISPVYWKLYGW